MTMAKILLVDDVNLLLAMQKSFLEPSPVHVITASNGEEALQLARTERPDVIVMDVNMPKMDGVACCTAIKSDPALCKIPVIMVTNVQRKTDIESCRAAGCDDLLHKPVHERVFREKIRQFLPVIERREQRVSCCINVTLMTSRETIAAATFDISRRGMYVVSDQELAPGTEVYLRFRLTGESQYQTTVKGRVAWPNSSGDRKKPTLPVGFGVEFLAITGEGIIMLRAKELDAFVQRHALPHAGSSL